MGAAHRQGRGRVGAGGAGGLALRGRPPARALASSAPSKSQIRPIAPLPPPLDELGLVPRCPELSLDAIDERFAPLLDAVVGAAREAAAVKGAASTSDDPLLGVYLRGSVPRGLFIEGVSDVDAVALVVGGGDGGQPSSSTANAAATAALAARLDGDSASAAAMAELRPIKVELRVQCVPPREVALLRQYKTTVPPSLARRALGPTLAFELATSAVTLPMGGSPSSSAPLDLPLLLPDVARLPPAPWLLPTVAAVERAVLSSAAASSSSSTAAARWALKRCVRAALELQFLGGGGAGSTSPGRRWTRDLYHCAALTRAAAESGSCRLSARVADAVDEALRLYVGLLDDDGGGGGGGGQKEQRRAAACAHARRLADALDAAFLAAMLSEAPGWLTRHVPPPAATADGRGGGDRRRAWWLPFGGKADNAAATTTNPLDNIAPSGQKPLFLVGCDPPPVHVRISGPPGLQFDWPLDGARAAEAATAALAAALGGGASSTTAPTTPQQQQQQPVLLRGFASRWPAARRWSFWALLQAAGANGNNNDTNNASSAPLRGKARAAPSLAFPFCEPALRDVLVAARGPAGAPSLEVDGLLASDFVRAMLLLEQSNKPPTTPTPTPTTTPLPPSHPYLYLQAELPEGHPMHADVRDGLEELRALLGAAVVAGPASTAPTPPTMVRVAQRPRLWASVRGSVSPTHFDRDASVLVQVVGRKRMLLFDPDQLECLSPYPEQHLLRRRARVNLAAEAKTGTTTPPLLLRSRLEAVEVVLEPGDAVFFPPEWAHYTESLTPSMSVTTRFCCSVGDGG